MKSHLNFILLLLMVIATTACDKKKVDYPKVYPGSYFPVYPGSWWKYINSGGASADTGMWTTSDDYVLTPIPDGNGSGVYKLVPLLGEVPIIGYAQITCFESAGPCYLAPFLSETVGAYFDWPRPRKYDASFTRWYVISKGTDANHDSVLLIKGEDRNPNGPTPYVMWKIYRKNVGLVLSCRIDTVTNDTVSKMVLADCHVSFKR